MLKLVTTIIKFTTIIKSEVIRRRENLVWKFTTLNWRESKIIWMVFIYNNYYNF